MTIDLFFIFEQAHTASPVQTKHTANTTKTNKLNMNSNFDEYNVDIDIVRKLNKFNNNKNDVHKKNKNRINREQNLRYARKYRRTVDKDWKDYNHSQSTPTESH